MVRAFANPSGNDLEMTDLETSEKVCILEVPWVTEV
jgi:hypothetical protein